MHHPSPAVHIFNREEPDLITHGNGKRYKPIRNGIGDIERARKEFIDRFGVEAWEERCKLYNKNKTESNEQNKNNRSI